MGDTKITVQVGDDDKEGGDKLGFFGVLAVIGLLAFFFLAFDENHRRCERDGMTVDECFADADPIAGSGPSVGSATRQGHWSERWPATPRP